MLIYPMFLCCFITFMILLLRMGNSIKQVYASLFIDENELHLLVSEYFNTRFNVIRVDKVKLEGISNFKISDRDLIVNKIKETIKRASDKIGARITKVILVLPALNFKRFPLRVSVNPTNGYITKYDVAKALSSSLKTRVDEDLMVVNSSIVKYYINGIPARRFPDREICNELVVDIDLLCADKTLCIDYVSLVQEAGIEVLDITLNNFAICKEAALFEQSLVSNVILLDIGNEHSYLSLISRGKLLSSEVIYDGMSSIYNHVKSCYDLPGDNLDRLIKYNVDFKTEHPDDAVFAWNDDKQANQSITIGQLSKASKGPTESLVEKVLTMCKPIIDSGPTTFFVTGEGAKMLMLISTLKELSKCDVKSYYPDTIGVRDSVLCSTYGSFFVYREKALLNELNVSCVDAQEYNQTVDKKQVDIDGESITSKIKKMFELYRDEEDSK